MDTNNESASAPKLYAGAYASHYAGHDLLEALHAYERLIAAHPGAPEAGYSRSQIQNIVHQVVPAAELLAAQMELACRHVQPGDAPG